MMVRSLRAALRRIPYLPNFIRRLRSFWDRIAFPGSKNYWESRYAWGGDSGGGSHGELAAFKAQVLNDFVREHGIQSVVEFGCGDGAQLALAHYPSYVGLDVAQGAIRECHERFARDSSKRFVLYEPDTFDDRDGRVTADLALSLDVVYHLVEDDIFEKYMTHLFAAARRFVVIYSSNSTARPPAPHVRHRVFTDWITANRPGWALLQRIPNKYPVSSSGLSGSFADFYLFAPA